jgi:hypothetical protein
MAIWEVRAEIKYGDRFWSNVWEVEIGSAVDVPPALILAFEDFHTGVLLDVYRLARIVRRPAGTTDEFIETIVDAAGEVVSSGSFTLPLFNVIRVVLNGGAGRPGIKFLRGVLQTENIIDDNFTINTSLITLVQNKLNDLFNAASDASCQIVFGSAPHTAVSGIPENTVHMRQQHRKRKKSLA